jgi:uncharacterized protein YndB with AHSA1/START domain
MMSEEKQLEIEVALDATPEAVWKALTEAEELKRWFALESRVTPGAGGSIMVSWSEGGDWETPIEIWEPNRRLRLADVATKAAVDYFIETRDGQTVLRLVHSGFSGDSWQDEIDSLDAGWTAFFANLKLYLERHPGEPRSFPHFRHPAIPIQGQEAFVRTMHVLGFKSGEPMQPGDRFAVTTESGDRFEGTVKVWKAPRVFGAVLENWNDAFLLVEIEGGKETCRPAVWISLYGETRAKAEELGGRLKGMLQKMFAPA